MSLLTRIHGSLRTLRAFDRSTSSTSSNSNEIASWPSVQRCSCRSKGWQVYRCIVYEAREDNVLSALVAGQWYEVSASFADEVIQFAESLPDLELPMPEAAEAIREDEYNR
jgi:uncharacterized protein (TIGR04141 family)